MDLTDIPTTPQEREAVFAAVTGLGGRDLTLPAGVSLTPPLPVGEHWVTAPGASLDRGVLVYVHGGGFAHRMPDLMNLFAARLSQVTGRPVLVVHYPLAPESPFPAALEAVIASFSSLRQHVPPSRVIVYSESSGGSLALGAMLGLSASSRPAGLIAVSPVTDLSLQSPSIDTNAVTDAGVDRRMLSFLIGQYLQGAPADRAPQSPIFGDLTGLPPLLLAVGSAEALLDDTLRFAEAATAAGIKTQVDVYEGLPHAFTIASLDDDQSVFLTRLGTWIAGIQ
ncbi:virginiamycin B lyase [Actinoplanes tereljensis]|nr:alpha/beta hydrolase [Actinoplanes tereljensis]